MQPSVAVVGSEQPAAPVSPEGGFLNLGTLTKTESLEQKGINRLRREIRANRVTFPAQVPIFVKHDRPDLQRKMVQLYFFSGWSTHRIAHRYSMNASRVHQIINIWKQRAVQMGYIQEIPSWHAPLRPVETSPIQIFLTQVVDTGLVCRQQDSSAKEMECSAEKAASGLQIQKHREGSAARREHEGNHLPVASEGDELTLLRDQNRLLKKLLLGLIANKNVSFTTGTFAEDARQFVEAAALPAPALLSRR